MAIETPIADPSGAPHQLTEALGTDYFSVRSRFTPKQWDTFMAVRRFVDHEVLPAASEAWDAAQMSWDVINKLPPLGIVGDDIAGNGCPGLDPLSCGLVAMELARGDGSLATFFAVQSGLAMKAIDMLGSDEQRARFLPGMARLETIGAFGLTEPDHGSDSVALETTARRDGDDWILDGAKRWIGNGSVAHRTVVWARNTDSGDVHGFVVDTTTPGYEASVIPRKGSMRSVWQADIRLDGVRVPESDRLPGAETFRDTGRVLATTRGTCAWIALGHATAGYDAALRYTLERTQFGKPLAALQIVQQRLVKMLAELTGMQLYCIQIAGLAEQGDISPTIAGLAKMNNTSKARWILSEARDLLGGNGILLDNHVMRHMADIESVHTFEGTETIQTLIVGREITGLSAFT
ncbi:acyl-CoA dehydrogenase family protein [Actinomycetospora termitidis]|uniref:Acyl-CoA dehydrogenase family protein n=1 Tax=Actinomycetospora termitidis TaxID=3053470 RepID=A0ABT7M2M5_9PSEU|nr:acyl-CoA dehydrogenase family protein [Actinomycetospora sp. Odt1-22]MDL5154920.1 acyl-CoA dehydrogenase family protein [Actinomycetospora sp. Odt1-22]